jgi:hypothetical protein
MQQCSQQGKAVSEWMPTGRGLDRLQTAPKKRVGCGL